MKNKRMNIVTQVTMVLVVVGGATAQRGCGGTVSSLAPCLSYVTGDSPAPSSSCCGQLATVVKSSPECLCSVINGSFGISINHSLALLLPAACNVPTPPPTRCNAANISGPTSSPAASPADVDSPDAAPNFPSGGGSKTVPSINGGSWNTSMHLLSLTSIALSLNLPIF